MKILKRGGVILLFGGLLLPSLECLSQEQEVSEGVAKEVVASGMGSIIGGDVAHARDDAIDDALRNGIEQALGTIVESETLVENFQLIEDKIISKTRGYVQKHVIVREGKKDEHLYEVTVKAFVKMANLKNDWDAIRHLINQKNAPRMMVFIKERNIGEAPGHYQTIEADMNTAESALMEAFMPKGFKFVDRSTVNQNLKRGQAAAILEGNVAQAAAFGKAVGAEVVITGNALAKATVTEAYGTKIRSQQATLSARAIRSDTGEIIAVGTAQGKFSHIDDITGGTMAIQRACEKLSEDLITKILDRWQTDVSSGTTITLNVRGIDGYAQLSKFKSSLKFYVRGLSSVVQRDWNEGFATLEVVMTGNSDDLASRLSGKDMEGFKVKVVGMSQNSVTVELVKGE